MQDYIKIARPDHWIKNIAILPGILLAWAIGKPQDIQSSLLPVLMAFLSAFLIGSSNYTINEILDADEDRQHPSRCYRPVPSGKITPFLGYMQWFLLALCGLILAWFENCSFFLTALLFFVMGLVYNVKPIRTKDIFCLDILSESFNSPLRFLLGWFTIKCALLPPISLIMSFWMLGAFCMSVKRMAELRFIDNPKIAAAYRKSFSHYNQERLIGYALFFATLFGVFIGIFIMKYRTELVLATPFLAGAFAIYIYEGFKKETEMRCPEKLYKQKFLMAYLFLTLIVIVGCFMVHIPWIK